MQSSTPCSRWDHGRHIDLLARRTYARLDVNGWCIGHFVTYALLGYVAPDYWHHFIAIGVVFEAFELLIEDSVKFVDCKLMDDIVVNTLGVMCGVFFAATSQRKLRPPLAPVSRVDGVKS